jgi:hypothetical protein
MQRPQRSARGNQASPAHSNTEGILVVKISYSVEEILDRLNEMREELLVIERSIERIFAIARRKVLAIPTAQAENPVITSALPLNR